MRPLLWLMLSTGAPRALKAGRQFVRSLINRHCYSHGNGYDCVTPFRGSVDAFRPASADGHGLKRSVDRLELQIAGRNAAGARVIRDYDRCRDGKAPTRCR
jgi:hypothetical protein